MNKILLMLTLLIVPTSMVAYERESLANFVTPSELAARQMQICILHRFYGKVNDDPLKNFFGMDQGAKVGLGLRAGLGKGMEIKILRGMSHPKDILLGLAYSRKIAAQRIQIEYQFLSYLKNFDDTERNSYGFGLLSIQSPHVVDFFSVIANIGYDNEENYIGSGFGLDLKLNPAIRLQGEYCLTKLDQDTHVKNSFSFGVKILTYGHHFIFTVGNSQAINTHQFMLGTLNNDLHFGFSIQRILEFD